MDQRSTWEVSEPKETTKLKHRAALETTPDMSAGQREFADGWNEMRAELLKNNLMKKK